MNTFTKKECDNLLQCHRIGNISHEYAASLFQQKFQSEALQKLMKKFPRAGSVMELKNQGNIPGTISNFL